MKPKSVRNKNRFREKIEVTTGVDECGTGALAGSVYAAAVIITPKFDKMLLNRKGKIIESKTINKKRIPEVARAIMDTCVYGIGEATNQEIDSLGIRKATELAMTRALINLHSRTGRNVEEIVVDGKDAIEGQDCKQYVAVRGDSRFYCVAAASIIAKYHRDEYMRIVHVEYPAYNFFENKGYATADHILALRTHGHSPLHRTTFNIVKNNGKK